MEIWSEEKAELAAYQLKSVAQVWFNQWKAERVDNGLMDGEESKVTFLDFFFPLVLRKAKVIDIINLNQGNMSVGEYSLMFTNLSKYGASIGGWLKSSYEKVYFVSFNFSFKIYRTTVLIMEMNISRLMTYA